jgi:hypothetical protein
MDILQLLCVPVLPAAAIVYALARNPATHGARRGGPDAQPVCVSVIVVNAAPRQSGLRVRPHATQTEWG